MKKKDRKKTDIHFNKQMKKIEKKTKTDNNLTRKQKQKYQIMTHYHV